MKTYLLQHRQVNESNLSTKFHTVAYHKQTIELFLVLYDILPLIDSFHNLFM